MTALQWKPSPLSPAVQTAEGVGGSYEIRYQASDDTARMTISPADARINYHNNPGFIRHQGVDPVERAKAEAQRREDKFDHVHEEGWWMPGKCVHILGYGGDPVTHAFRAIFCGEVVSDLTIHDYRPGGRAHR